MTEEIETARATWLGPRSAERPADAGFTLVAGLEAQAPARVDGGGLLSPADANWSLDWWIGADDRWHLPAREPSVRQRRVGNGPVIETSLRVPSGDVLHTAYPVVIRGGTATVVEIRNESPVPVALALALRPYSVDDDSGTGSGPMPTGPDLTFAIDDEVLTVDGVPAVVLPRSPNEAGASADSDLLLDVQAGKTLQWEGPVRSAAANTVCLYPLPHRTSLRFVILGAGGADFSGTQFSVDGLPDAESVARGWTAVVDRASRYEFPDSGITALAGAARARLLLAANDLPAAVVEGDAVAGPILEGLAIGGHRLECRNALEAFAASFPTTVSSAVSGGELCQAIGLALEMLGDKELSKAVLEPLTQLTHLSERAAGKQPAPADATGRANARSGLARAADLVGQHRAAIDLRSGLDRPAAPPVDLAAVSAMAEQAAPAQRWSGRSLTVGSKSDGSLPAARFWLAARQLLVREARSPAGEPVIELLPDFPTAWRGGSVEVHSAPVVGLLVSFAIRWHGYRPALLWEVTSAASDSPVHLTCPGLDPGWHTVENKGEALLEGQAEELPAAPAPGDSFS